MAYIFLIVAFIFTMLLFPLVIKMVIKTGFVRPNYRQEKIPMAVGFVFVLVAALTLAVLHPLIPMNQAKLFVFLFAIFALTLLGLLDDFFGSRDASGLKGHFKKLIKEGELTTGAVKAIAGGIIALLVSMSLHNIQNISDAGMILLDALIVALSTNAINLLDLRPGRAAKGFLLGAVLLTLFAWRNPDVYFLFIIAGSVMAYLPYDLKAKVMMGDTGSNVLGVTLGITGIWVLSYSYKLGYLIFLLLFHLFTEKYSLTAIIEKNPVLRFFDMLGRK